MSRESRSETDEMASEYDIRGGVRGKYYKRYREGTNVVLLGAEGDQNASKPNPFEAAKVVRKQTEEAFPQEVKLALRLLDFYIAAFNSIGKYTATEAVDQKLLILGLTSRSFNSSLCAYSLILDGYYTQATMIVRHILEDWLLSHRIAFNPKFRAKYASDPEVRLQFQNLANEVGPEFGKWWRNVYGTDSAIAHPQPLSMGIQIEGESVRLGPVFDKDLALFAFARLLLSGTRMADVLAQTVDLIHKDRPKGQWAKKLEPLATEVGAWFDRVSETTGSVPEASAPTPEPYSEGGETEPA